MTSDLKAGCLIVLKKLFCGLVAAATIAGAAQASDDQKGVLKFGQSAALDGAAKALGEGMRLGLLAAFNEVNAKGGVHGRKLELVSKDDGYEPEKAIKNTRELLADSSIFALIGAVGTPTSKAAQPISTEKKAPYIGPFTGAGFLRNPDLGNIINFRASYGQETEAWIKHLTEDRGYKRIAILYQDDSFGRVGLAGVEKAMKKRGIELVAKGSYERNTVAVKSALLKIRKAKPEAVVMVGAYKPMAEFIRLSRKLKMNPTFVNISFVGSRALAKELGKDGEGVIISQVVPFPWDASVPVVADYHKALKAIDAKAEPGFVSLEGYLVGRMTIAALERAGADPTREAFLKAFKAGEMDLGGLKLTFGDKDNQGSEAVYLTVIQADGSFKPVAK
ncbi:MAG: ABC transporter substrate-binding protein [Neomegalonema sp.]|nr:ABC transporter substrate-binding protein [Neomegalonema sp.]